MQLKNVRYLNGGYCWQNVYLSGVASLKFRRFQAVFVSFEHPQHGNCLIDTGYGPDVFAATRSLPWRILSWMTPIPRRQQFNKPNYLEQQRIEPANHSTIFISHFHADHIGGTKLFPNSKFVYRSQSLSDLNTMSNWEKLNSGFIPSLLPDDFAQRGLPLEESQFTIDDARLPHFQSHDYWGDGSLILVDLPGHALGHTGFLLNTQRGRQLYVVDSFWDRRAFDKHAKLPWLSKRILKSYEEYQETNRQLQQICSQRDLTPLACHCPMTQEQVEADAN